MLIPRHALPNCRLFPPPAPLSQDENCVCLFPRTDSIPQQKKIPRHGMHMNILQLTREMVSRIVGGEWSVFISLGELFSTEEVMWIITHIPCWRREHHICVLLVAVEVPSRLPHPCIIFHTWTVRCVHSRVKSFERNRTPFFPILPWFYFSHGPFHTYVPDKHREPPKKALSCGAHTLLT
jgi:hypothetical protein